MTSTQREYLAFKAFKDLEQIVLLYTIYSYEVQYSSV